MKDRGAARQLLLDPFLAGVGPSDGDAVVHGEVFTRPWIVELILDLIGYVPGADLADKVAIEPACGSGAFLGPMVGRISASCRLYGRPINDAAEAIRAFDIIPQNVDASRRVVEKVLVEDGWDGADAARLAERWIRAGDFLLAEHVWESADFVVGNPPYVRLEDVPADRMIAYRNACPTMVGRADIYVGFIETGLRSLSRGGVLGFICADRWMRNQYGQRLRSMIADGYDIETIIGLHGVDAFEESVSAYPAIVVVRPGEQGEVAVIDAEDGFGADDVADLERWMRSSERERRSSTFQAARLSQWFDGDDPWPTGSPARLALLEHLNERFGLLEDPETGTRVGIGVATGADGVFVVQEAAVEPERLLPLAMVRDTTSGTLTWGGTYLVNPWDKQGHLVDLARYPLLNNYYLRNAERLQSRHVSRKSPKNWFRTIDRVDPALLEKSKLLLPDMKTSIHPVLDEGGFYPHHNLYYVVSRDWDLRVLGGILLSRLAQAFIEAYAVRMRGGTLRFQAQYLRRIRVPLPTAIAEEDKRALRAAFEQRDVRAATAATLRAFKIDDPSGELLNELHGGA